MQASQCTNKFKKENYSSFFHILQNHHITSIGDDDEKSTFFVSNPIGSITNHSSAVQKSHSYLTIFLLYF